LEGSQVSPVCLPGKSNMQMKHWWNDTDRENQSTRRKTSPSATLFTINFTWTDPGSILLFRDDRRATNRLSHGAALKANINTLHTHIQFVPRR
jgi:hypothetical protein